MMKKMFVWMAAVVVMITNVACAGGNKTEKMADDQKLEQVGRLLEGINATNYAEKMDSLCLICPDMDQESIAAIKVYCEFMIKVKEIAEGQE